MRHKSKHHQFRHLIRLTRRRALASLKSGNESGGTAYRLYIWLCDNEPRLVRVSETPPLAVQCVRVRAYLAMKRIGWIPCR